MPINISELPPLSLKEAIERTQNGEIINIITHDVLEREIKRIAHEAFALMRPKDLSYVSSIPSADDMQEMQCVLVYDGTNYKVAVKINGVVKSVALS